MEMLLMKTRFYKRERFWVRGEVSRAEHCMAAKTHTLPRLVRARRISNQQAIHCLLYWLNASLSDLLLILCCVCSVPSLCWHFGAFCRGVNAWRARAELARARNSHRISLLGLGMMTFREWSFVSSWFIQNDKLSENMKVDSLRPLSASYFFHPTLDKSRFLANSLITVLMMNRHCSLLANSKCHELVQSFPPFCLPLL